MTTHMPDASAALACIHLQETPSKQEKAVQQKRKRKDGDHAQLWAVCTETDKHDPPVLCSPMTMHMPDASAALACMTTGDCRTQHLSKTQEDRYVFVAAR